MQTQTGGEGETVQLQNMPIAKPEDFDVNIPPQQAEQPVQQEAPQPQITEQQAIQPPVDSEPMQPAQEPTTPPTEQPTIPPVQAEQGQEVSLSDDADTQSAFTEAGVMPNMSMAPKSVEESAELDLSGYTIDGAEQHKDTTPIEEVEEIEIPESKTIDLSGYTIDGADQHVDLEAKKKEEKIKSEYAGTPVKIDKSGTVKIEKPKEEKKEDNIEGELYTYKNRPGVMYKRKGPNDWYIDVKNNGKFVKITTNAESRIKELEKNATKVGGKKEEKGKALTEANRIIQSRFGDVKDFTNTELLTSGGDPTITKGLSFNQLTKPNTVSKADRYTNSGQINFNYDPNYAASNKETRAILDAGDKVKVDGVYRYPGSNALYKREGGNWLKDSSGTGKNYKPLSKSKGDIKERTKALESKAIPVNEYTASFNVSNVVANNPFIFNKANKKSKFQLESIADIDLINPSSFIQEAEDKYTFEEAKNFADKDLINMFAKDNTFSGKQLTDMLEMQKQAKAIVADGKYDPIKAKSAEGLMTDLNEYYNQAKAINEKINSAYSKDMSLDRYNLEEKRKDYNDFLNVASSTSDIQDAAKSTFESTLKIADFIQAAIDDGKMLYDRENGGYKFSENLTPLERKYIENGLAKQVSEYNKAQDTKFESLNADLNNLKSTYRDNLAKSESIKGKIEKAEPHSEEWKNLYKELYSLSKENKSISKEIDNKQSLKSTVFLTEPKKLVASMTPTESASTIFNAIPEKISPKQKFDLFYKQLVDKNDRLAKENNIDGESLTGKLSQYGRELLDWGGYFSLSDKEKEWLNNKSMLNQLSPLYFNNDYGFTEGSGGFYDSFVNSFGQLLAPKVNRAQGYFNQSEAANTIMNTLNEQGFSKDDIVDANYVKSLKDKANVDFWSREQWGGMLGTTAGIIAPLIVTKKIPMTALKVAGRLENIVAKTKNAENLALYLTRAENVFDSTLKATKYGKYLVNPIKTGLEFEATGRVFGSTKDEMYFLSGFTGGLASEGFSGLIAKMPTNKVYGYIRSMFGTQTDKAVNVLKKIGEANVRGITETAEEFGNELSNIYTDQLREKGFFDEVKAQFGDLDKVQEFVISTYMMGAAFGIVDSDKKRAAYDSLPKEKKEQVDNVLNSVRHDIQSANQNVDKYANEQEEEVDRKQTFEKDLQKETKTNETGDIEFDPENIEEASEGRPSVVAEAKAEPSSFTEPIDLTKLEEDAEENKPGVPSEERKGEEPVETKPVTEPSEETPSPSGMVQEEQKQAEEVTTPITETKEPSQEVKNFADRIMNGKKITSTEDSQFYENNKEEIDSYISDVKQQQETEVKPVEEVKVEETATPTTTTMFSEATDINKIKSRTERKAAETAFEEKHGVSHKKVSKIDANFANITKNLEKNNLIEINCK